MRTLAFILTLALAAPALAADWLENCGTSRKTTAVGPNGYVCFDPAANDDDSPILSVGQCDYTNWSYHEDKDGSGTSSTVEYTIQICADRTLTGTSADNGCRQVEGTDVLGSSATDLDEAGIGVGPWLRVQANGSGTDPGQGRIIVTCSRGVGGL